MVDRVRPMKIEGASIGGDGADDVEFGYSPTEPNEDAIDAHGYYIQSTTSSDSSTFIGRDASDNMTFTDGVVGTTYTLSDLAAGGGGGLTEGQHEALDSLAHELVENSYDVVTYSGNKISNVTTWTNNSLVTKIREQQLTHSGNKVTQSIEIQYDASGVEKYRIVETYSYTGNNITAVARTKI